MTGGRPKNIIVEAVGRVGLSERPKNRFHNANTLIKTINDNTNRFPKPSSMDAGS